jgi:two-component system, chemotaxis family, sensor kinase Cph1
MSGVQPNHISEDRASQAVSEAVHLASSIQPHGVLCVLRQPGLIVQQVSANVQNYFDIAPEELLEQPLAVLLGESAVAAIQQAVARIEDCAGRLSQAALRLSGQQQAFSATLHRRADCIILELEPVLPSGLPSLQLHTAVKQTIAQLRQVPDLTDFLQLAALQVQQLTGFDRVVIYQFDAQGAGEVVAEAKHSDLPTYLGLHYPATDIPESVRMLYRHGMVRYIPDLEAPFVELIPDQPLPDLSLTVLRSVDTCCVEYHRNMGLAAILVMALVQGETLWGLVSCHHRTPKFVPYELRESCEVLAQLIASELAHKVNVEELNYLTKLRSLQSEFIQSIAQADDFRQALAHPAPRLLDLVGAQGAAVCLGNEMTLVGTTPSQEQIQALLHWIETVLPQIQPAQSAANALFHTDSLPKLYPEAAAFQDSASGLLMLQISKVRRYSILWFRPEVLQTVNWAGNPSASLSVAVDGAVTLCPRTSFKQWQEIVRFTALPWKNCELENALDLRSAIVGIVLKKADELAQMNQELERSVRELDSFAYAASHDLKEPLRGIHNFSNLLLKGYADVLDEVGQSRLHTLIRLTRRMESLIDALLKLSRLSHAELHRQPTDLNQSVQQVLEDLRTGHPDLPTDIRIPRLLPTVNCDPILVEEVLANLISNAVKYNDKSQPWIELGYLEADDQQPEQPQSVAPTDLPPLALYVRDNGIGIRERHLNSVFRLFKRLHEQHLYGGGTGAGLAITKKIIERHGGQLWVASTSGEGSTFYFTLEPIRADAAL